MTKKIISLIEDDAAMLKKPSGGDAPSPGKPGLDPSAKEAKASKEMEMMDEAIPGAEKQADPAVDPTATAGAGDNVQDIAIFKKMISDALGDAEEPSDDLVHTTKEMYQAACESGMSDEDAKKHVGAGLKMAKIMGNKHGKAAAEAQNPAPDGTVTTGAEKEAIKKESGDEKAVMDSKEKKESAVSAESVASLKEKLAKVTGENAVLKEAIKKTGVENHLDKLCRESGYAVSVTKAFRELVKNAKSADEVTATWKTFKTAIDGVKEESRSLLTESGFTISIPEKMTINPRGEGDSGSESIKSTGFMDCIS